MCPGLNVLYLAVHQEFPASHAGFSHVLNICSHIQALEHRVLLVSKRTEGAGERFSSPFEVRHVLWNLDYPVTPLERMGKQVLQLLGVGEFHKAVATLSRWGKEHNARIVHERHDMKLDLGPAVADKLGTPSVLEVNSPFLEEYLEEDSTKFQAMNRCRKQGFDSASVIITQTATLARIIAQHTSTPIEVIPNGADPELFNPEQDTTTLKEKLGMGHCKVIGFSGSFKPWHGVGDLIKAFQSVVRKESGNVRLLLIGGGDAKKLALLKKLVSDHDLSSEIIFTGPVPYLDVPKYLALCDILAAPFSPGSDQRRKKVFGKYGLWWSPLKIFEYMAMAKPVVSPSVGMIPEYMEGAGLTYEEGDVEGLADRLLELLSNHQQATSLGDQGRRRVVQNYTWRIAAEKTLQVYEKLLEGGP